MEKITRNRRQPSRQSAKRLSVPVAALALAALPAQATLIDFDDLTQLPCTDLECVPLAVTDQYAELGVTFGGAGLLNEPGSPAVQSSPNAIYDFYGPGMGFSFSGLLPSEVSFYVSAAAGDAVYVNAYDITGAVIASVTTDGYQGPVVEGPAYRDRQLVSFSGLEIASIGFSNFYNRRGIMLDDLAFSTGAAAVPGPGSVGLLITGLVLLWWARWSRRL